MMPLPLRDRSRLAQVLLGAAVAAAVLAAHAHVAQWALLDRALDGGRVSLAEIDDARREANAIGIFGLVVQLLAAITFLLWFSRAYRNTIAMGFAAPRHGTGWAVGSWFVPIANMIVPKRVLDDIWRGSDPAFPRTFGSTKGFSVPVLIHAWWALWLLATVGWRVVDLIWFRATQIWSVGDMKAQALVYVGGDLAALAAGVLGILVVRRVTARQEERRALLAEGLVPPHPLAPPVEPAPAVAPA